MNGQLRLDVRASAVFSPNRRYRYHLWREWDPWRPRCAFVMLNPSSADETVNDPTVERCERRARAWGYGALDVVNLFAYRSTDPQALTQVEDPFGPENDAAILAVARAAALVVCAWGACGIWHGRADAVRRLLAGVPLYCLRTNAATGTPTHPLYVPYNETPKPYSADAPEWRRP